MARAHANVKLAMWSDDDFRSLSLQAQHLYFALLTSPSLSYCGVADWRPNRVAALSTGTTTAMVRAAASELTAGRFAYFNDDTEEALIRSFIRNDGLMAREKMGIAMTKAHAAVACSRLRGYIVHELKRLREDQPGLDSWRSEKVLALLTKASAEPPSMASAMPLDESSSVSSGMPNSDLSVEEPPTTATATATSSRLPAAPAAQDESSRKKPAKRLPEDWAPTSKHQEYAEEHGIQLDGEVFKFRNHAEANDRRQANWNAAFSTWLANAAKWSKPKGNPNNTWAPWDA